MRGTLERGILNGMSNMPPYPDTLELIDPLGDRVKVADIVVSDPIEQDGLRYQTIAVTTLLRKINPGVRLQIVDAARDDKVVCEFIAESIKMFFRGEQFIRVDGKHYLKASGC